MKSLLIFTFLVGTVHGLPKGTKVHKDLAYVIDGHENQKLDLHLPARPNPPLLIYIHGGAWWGGSKDAPPHLELLDAGYAVASIEYRFSQHAIFPAQIEDCKAAVRWLRAHSEEYKFDGTRIAALGDSAGGHLTSLLATTGDSKQFDVGENLDESSAITCGIELFGPTDLVTWQPTSDLPMIQREGQGSCLVQLLGGPVDEKVELARQASPLRWVTKPDAPLLIFHGTKDPLVKLRQSELLVKDYTAADIEIELVVIEGAGHGGPEFITEENREKVRKFLDRHLATP